MAQLKVIQEGYELKTFDCQFCEKGVISHMNFILIEEPTSHGELETIACWCDTCRALHSL